MDGSYTFHIDGKQTLILVTNGHSLGHSHRRNNQNYAIADPLPISIILNSDLRGGCRHYNENTACANLSFKG